ncbi:Putative DNA helicase ino80 [Malassezia sp. CBS 17886]|nr:Putative DNA helicase ino80 [Malassezia sp. CBS 17886]
MPPEHTLPAVHAEAAAGSARHGDASVADDAAAAATPWDRPRPAMPLSSILNQRTTTHSPSPDGDEYPPLASSPPPGSEPWTHTPPHHSGVSETGAAHADPTRHARLNASAPAPAHARAPSRGEAVERSARPHALSPVGARGPAASGWDSDLSAEENEPLWTAELAVYRDARTARREWIAAAWDELCVEAQGQDSERLCRTYQARFLASKRRERLKCTADMGDEAGEADDIDLELLDTLTEKKGRTRRRSDGDESPDDYLDALARGAADSSADDARDAADDETPIPQLIDPDSGVVRGVVPIGARRAAHLEDAHRDVWTQIARREIPKVYRTVVSTAANRALYRRRVSSVVQREAKRGAARNNKSTKDIQLRARKVMRELLLYWKRNEREERELRKKAEKEALDKAKKEEEMREAKRQARKLNFLITQTELYSHFVGNKLKTSEAEESEETEGGGGAGADGAQKAGPLVGSAGAGAPTAPALGDLDFDDDDESNLRAHAARNANAAVQAARDKAHAFDAAVADERRTEDAAPGVTLGTAFDSEDMNFNNPTSMGATKVAQPKMLTCALKPYQLKGLSWLANLYEQGINGILADEMGLGKTVQSIALMAYLAEVHDIWGPFLVIAPASTLHNWQQEITRFVPALKALPYWGNVKDRAVLRKFWNRKKISYDRDAPFHVLVTSYQLVVSDEKYFQRVKWQYMVLDEAQAIKSSSSNRWKTLLGFNCRNRLLLTGTPVQNSMQELWALLHFIMPSLFDSHDEFSEWFSKDIENHAENRGTLNEHQLRRLHMILKPFMLRRIKKNVQNELGDKARPHIEVDLYCDLSARQRLLYQSLRSHVSADLVDKAANANDEAGLRSLMNLVMQFRKVCNHPELFERADVRAPLACGAFAASAAPPRDGDMLSCSASFASLFDVHVPRLLVQDALVDVPTASNRAGFDTHYLGTLMNIWRPAHMHDSLQTPRSAFSFLRLLGAGPDAAHRAFHAPALQRVLGAAQEDARRARSDALVYDSGLAAHHACPHGTVRRAVPYARVRPAPGLVPLGEIARQAVNERLGDATLRVAIAPVVAAAPALRADDRVFVEQQRRVRCDADAAHALFGLAPSECEDPAAVARLQERLPAVPPRGLVAASSPMQLWKSPMQVPAMNKLIVDSAKLARLDALLRELKANGHRVLIYFQMTRMIDLMEEYLIYRQYKYLRLDGASKISDRRDMVTDWQTRPELFVFLLSTRAGGLGINLTAADTVIFFDHDWNPSNDSQAMDRAHRLGQTKQVTVYRLITKGTIDERIVKLARNKKEVQDIVVGNKAYSESGMAKPQEIVSLLLDDDELADTMVRRKHADEAQLAHDKAESARAVQARRRMNRAAAASAAASGANTPSVAWSLDNDEDDFFGAKPPVAEDAHEESPPASKSKKRAKREGAPAGAKRSRKGKTHRAPETPAEAAV